MRVHFYSMKLNHLNLSVSDVAESARLFEQVFGLRCTERKGRDTLAVSYDDSGISRIVSNFDRKTTPAYPKDFHLGFIQNDQAQVMKIHRRLEAAGIELNSPRSMHGSWGFYFTAPGGIPVEVSCPFAAESLTESGS